MDIFFSVLKNLSSVTIFILFSFVFSVILFNKNKVIHWLVLLIITIGIVNELLNLILIIFRFNISFNTNLYSILHNILWFILLIKVFKKYFLKHLLFTYLVFCTLNLLFFEGIFKFNYKSFILGSFFYCLASFYFFFEKLKNEEINFFKSNDFILISSPILFFIGLSFIFSFQSDKLAYFKIFYNFPLFQFISYSVNIFYYTQLNIYIYRERKLQNA